MSTYRFLQDAYVSQAYYQAGTIAATLDSGGTLPINWVPPPTVEPMDASATNAFYNAGRADPAYCSFQFLISDQFGVIKRPTTRWQGTSMGTTTSYTLTGLGQGLPAIPN